jgi:hypothetical protein
MDDYSTSYRDPVLVSTLMAIQAPLFIHVSLTKNNPVLVAIVLAIWTRLFTNTAQAK